jgi:hypothetical protein
MIARSPVALSWQKATCSWPSGERGAICHETDTVAAPRVKPSRANLAQVQPMPGRALEQDGQDLACGGPK